MAYFRDEFVRKRGWVAEEQFAQCVAIAQLLPGPASSQTGILIGLLRGGWPGAFAAWIGFTLPSAVLMTAFALYAPRSMSNAGWLHGLLVAAVAIVAYAIVMMRRALIRNTAQFLLAVGTCAVLLLRPGQYSAPLAIAACALLGLAIASPAAESVRRLDLRVSRTGGGLAFIAFLVLLVLMPIAANAIRSEALVLAARLFATGSLVFGGGHVVLPLLQSQVVSAGIASPQRLIAGYAAAQAVPGPLFTISAYIGAVAYNGQLGIAGAAVALAAIFAPSFFLIAAIAPFYGQLSSSRAFRRALNGANAGVVGLLASAFATPIWTNAIHSLADALLAAAAFAALAVLRAPNWLVVALCAAAGFALFR